MAQHVVRAAPAIEASVDGLQHVGEHRDVAVVRREAPGESANSLDRSELRAVGWQEQQPQVSGVAAEIRWPGVSRDDSERCRV